MKQPARQRLRQEAVEAEIVSLLKAFSLDPPRAHVTSLADQVRWLREKRECRGSAFDSRLRSQAAVHARKLERDIKNCTRQGETTERRREELMEMLDSLPVVVQLAATTDSLNITPVMTRLDNRTYTANDMAMLAAAIERIPKGAGGRRNAPFRSLLVAGVHVWEVCGRTERYTANRYTDELVVTGPLPDFIRALIDLAGLEQPKPATLERHLREVKNV